MGQIPCAPRSHTWMQVKSTHFDPIQVPYSNKLQTGKGAFVIIDLSCPFKIKQFQLTDIRLDYKLLCQEPHCIFAVSLFVFFHLSTPRFMTEFAAAQQGLLTRAAC